jgi:hypothetical protein
MPTILVTVPFLLLPVLHLPGPTAACQFDVLTPSALEERALEQFNTAIDQYVTLHRRLERSLPPEQMFDDPEDMFAAREALRSAIADARPNARPGGIFAPTIAQVIVERLERTIRDRGHDPYEILADINQDRLPGMAEPQVNGEFPWGAGSTMWPSLLHALPPLPQELEYRFWDRHLVLVDGHANLVVDILENALPGIRTNETN